MKVLVTGGSGFVGSHLTATLVGAGHEVVVLTRGRDSERAGVRYVNWNAKTLEGAWTSELSNAEGIVNLAGANIGKWPWTRRRQAELIGSRLSATSAIVRAIEAMPADRRPAALVNASGIDYYGDRHDDNLVTEDAPVGDSFLARLSQQWEAAARKAEPLGVRVVYVRTAMAWASEAPAFRLLTLPFRLFVGGPLGSGRQWFTWIHIDDLVGIYRLSLENQQLSGPINATAPEVRREREVAREIARVMHRPDKFPAPALLLGLVLGQMSQLLLHGRRATPSKAQAAGYPFRFGGLHEALEDILR